MLQAALLDCLFFDRFPFSENVFVTPEVDVRGRRCSGSRDSGDCCSDRQRHQSAAPDRLAGSSFPGEYGSSWFGAIVRSYGVVRQT